MRDTIETALGIWVPILCVLGMWLVAIPLLFIGGAVEWAGQKMMDGAVRMRDFLERYAAL